MDRILPDGHFSRLKSAAQDRTRVQGATHNFYRYPARFSPRFAREAIDVFTEPGDLVLDPFVGGGTTAVEALRAGRRCIGADINELAIFVSTVKSTVLTEDETLQLRLWRPGFERALRISRDAQRYCNWQAQGYFRHLEGTETWRHRNLIAAALRHIETLNSARLEQFARCVVLRAAQLSLDNRKCLMTISELRGRITRYFHRMLKGMEDLQREVVHHPNIPSPTILNCDASRIHEHGPVTKTGAPRLIVTSPPYPGIHVRYHRWQINGRRETPAPYWIANKLDGNAERYYTLGGRYEKELKTYFANLESIFLALVRICDFDTRIVQMVGFSNPDWQLRKYLEVMQSCGLEEYRPRDASLDAENGRLWRDVPNRGWYVHQQPHAPSAREVVLVHRKMCG
ncbi:MAG: site-specific DNA-methyltransferase [Rhodobacteraceae bacterium]|nr:site-specific DNA-methyltransferase [Paracoccaceae bacterium]